MKLIPVENIPNRKYKAQKNMDIVREFINSQLRCALIEGNGTKGLSSNLQEAIKKMGLKNAVRACRRNGKTYLIRLDPAIDDK